MEKSMEFSRTEYWSGLPCPSPGGLPNPGIEPWSPILQVDSLLSYWGTKITMLYITTREYPRIYSSCITETLYPWTNITHSPLSSLYEKKKNYLKHNHINNKVLLYSARNSIQNLVINHNGKEYEKEHIYV